MTTFDLEKTKDITGTEITMGNAPSDPSERGDMASQLSKMMESGTLKTKTFAEATLAIQSTEPAKGKLIRGGRGTKMTPGSLMTTIQEIRKEEGRIKYEEEDELKQVNEGVKELNAAHLIFAQNIGTLKNKLSKNPAPAEEKRLNIMLSMARDNMGAIEKILPINTERKSYDSDALTKGIARLKEYEDARRKQMLAEINQLQGRQSEEEVMAIRRKSNYLYGEIFELTKQGGGEIPQEKIVTNAETTNPTTMPENPQTLPQPQETPTAPESAVAQSPKLNQEALDLIHNTSDGVPAFMTANLKKIAKENGISVQSSDTPNSVIDKLRALDSGEAVAPQVATVTEDAQAKPAAALRPALGALTQEGYDLLQDETLAINENEGGLVPEATPEPEVAKENTVGNVAGVLSPEEKFAGTPDAEQKKEVENILETLTPEEKKEFSLGIDNIGYAIEEGKNKVFAGAFSWARERGLSLGWLKKETIIDKDGNEIEQAGKLERWIQSFSENLTKDAEASRKKKENSEETSFSQLSSIGVATGNILKYGRLISDMTGLSLASPFRYCTMGAMFFGQAFGAGKEARLKNIEVLEKTRIEDINAAADEAWRIYEQASAGKENVSREDLEKAYMNNAPQDILNRLKKDAEPGTASSVLGKVVKWDITESLERISSKLDRIDNDSSLDDMSKKIEREKVLQKYEQHIKDLDRAVGQFGTVDTISLGAKYGEAAAKALVGGLMVETVALSIDKLWNSLPSILHSAPGAGTVEEVIKFYSDAPLTHTETPVATAVSPENLVAAGSFIEIAQSGDSVWKMTEHQLETQLGEKFTSLSPEQQTYIVDAVKDRIGQNPDAFGVADINNIEVGKGIDFTNALNDKEFVANAFAHAQGLSPEEIANIKNYDSSAIPEAEARVLSLEEITALANQEVKSFDVIPTAEVVHVGGEGMPTTEAVPVGVLEQSSPSELIAHPDAHIKVGNIEGTFQYSPDGKTVTGFTSTGDLSVPETLEAQKILKDGWRGIVLSNETGLSSLNTNTAEVNAKAIFQYEQIIKALNEQGGGMTPEADFLRDEITRIITDTEKTYGDVFKDIEGTQEVTSPLPMEETNIMPQDITPGNPEVVTSASKYVHTYVNDMFGTKGIFGFGAVDGMKTPNWLDFANRPVAEIMQAQPNPTPSNAGLDVGMKNNDALAKIQQYLKVAIDETGVQPARGETTEKFLTRAAEITLGKTK